MTTSLSGGNAVPAAQTPEAPNGSPPPGARDGANPETRASATHETTVEADATPVRPLRRALVVLSLTAVAAICLDLLTKQLALNGLSDGSNVRLFGGLVYLDLTRNSGAAFSIGRGYTMIFPVITVVVVSGILWLARHLRSVPWGVAMGLVLGGALGNLMDRLFRAPGPFRGHVVDFVSMFAPGGQVFAIFNAADSALFCGVVLAILLEFSGRRRDGTRASTGRKRVSADPSGGPSVRDSDHEDA